MGTAYTPGLTISSGTIVKKQRRLPLKGEVLVKVGDKVESNTVVARTEIPGVVQTIRVAEKLGLEADDALKAILVKVGDSIETDQVIAESRSFFGLFKSVVKSSIRGKVELISSATGHVGIRLPPRPVEVDAYIDGIITEVIPSEGVVVETYGAMVQGIFGVGGEKSGKIVVPNDTHDAPITEDSIREDYAGCIIVGGAGVTVGALRKAASLGVNGIVVAAIIDTELIDYLGYDIGVAITGQEDIQTSLILTEGFGDVKMADRTFKLLKSIEGRIVSINGATQIRAGVIRPEIIAPLEARLTGKESEKTPSSLDNGTLIRIIREPYFGMLGKVKALPSEPVEVESGVIVRILEAELNDGRLVIVPRANVEIIES